MPFQTHGTDIQYCGECWHLYLNWMDIHEYHELQSDYVNTDYVNAEDPSVC